MQLLKIRLDKIDQVDDDFQKLCNSFSEIRWGLVSKDFIGVNINKYARLCGIARPFGIVIEYDDFRNIPKDTRHSFVKQTRKFVGIVDDVDVWVTNEISDQLIPREKVREAPEVHIAGLCIKTEGDDIKALIAKRNSDRKLFPSMYEGCGGQLKYSESFVEGVKRHFSREMHIDVDVIESIYSLYKIEVPGEPLIPGIRFLCKYIDGTPKSKNHTEVKWVSKDELIKIPSSKFIPGLKEEFINFLDKFIDLQKRFNIDRNL